MATCTFDARIPIEPKEQLTQTVGAEANAICRKEHWLIDAIDATAIDELGNRLL